jgi:hypothetical protein
MARDHARIRLDIWADEDWRDLPSLPQWLYLHLLSAPSLSFCGVTDWRPARIAALAVDLSASDVEYAAAWLEAWQFLIIDRETEEALIRSWVKHDGLLASPNMTKAMVKAHGAIGSGILRAVIVDQLERLKQNSPGLAGWKHIGTVLRKRSLTVDEAFLKLPPNPSIKGSANPSEIRAELQTPYSVLHTPPSDHPSPEISHLTSEREEAAS